MNNKTEIKKSNQSKKPNSNEIKNKELSSISPKIIKNMRKNEISRLKEFDKENLSKAEYNLKYKKHIKKNSKENVIDLIKVNKFFVNGSKVEHILKDITFSVKKGEVFLILGPSGSGKTTLLNVMAGLTDASSGDVVVNNQNLFLMSENKKIKFRAENLSFVFQSYNLIPTLNVEENIKVGATLRNAQAEKLDISEIMKLLNLYEQRKKFPYQLSGGQNQRVSIGRALAKNPKILFADEPTGALDEERGKEALQFLLDINKRFNTTIIMISHNPNFVSVANTILKINNGTIFSFNKNTKIKKAEEVKWT